MTTKKPIPAVSFQTSRSGVSVEANTLGVRLMRERACIGLSFGNDTERLQKLFELYTKLTGKKAAA
ncbi:hypothetical protein [Novosphingobium subterraneum]|uniref:Uncharacterized protein n=1 Tax=Novosphingobium subterraneum TaxID=48936 RepID=A0A0B9A8Z2_9SPHN|nr:hypothetical protein [Novosphingobium subterraneum]KHS45832.1 hypothetical protein NJ75_02437 [Novosphingobium subterraneum]